MKTKFYYAINFFIVNSAKKFLFAFKDNSMFFFYFDVVYLSNSAFFIADFSKMFFFETI